MTIGVLEDRLVKVRQAMAAKKIAVREVEHQINALLGREAELTELIAILARPVDHGEA